MRKKNSSMKKKNRLPSRQSINMNGLKDTSSQRKLYVKSGLSDNENPSDFLASLKRNAHVKKYTLEECSPTVCLVSLQLSAVIAFSAAFAAVEEIMSGETLLSIVALSVLIGYLSTLLWERKKVRDIWDDVKRALVFLAFGYSLSPVLFRYNYPR